MSLLINGAGGSAADPVLKGLGVQWVAGASSMDIATVVEAWIDQASGFPGTNSVKSSLSPASTVVTAGNNGTYTDSNKRYGINSTTGLSVGDYLYLSHAGLTDGLYQIASIPTSGFVTLVTNPLDGGGDQTGIAFQVAWRYDGVAGTSPIVSDSAGTRNYFKLRSEDGSANQVDSEDSIWVRDAPSGTSYISIDGKAFTGQTTNDPTPSLSILSGWTNRGGISHVALANHSVQSVNNFTFSDDSTSEKTLSAAESSGLKLSSGDGIKYGRLIFTSKSGGVQLGVDISITLDSAGPNIVMVMFGR